MRQNAMRDVNGALRDVDDILMQVTEAIELIATLLLEIRSTKDAPIVLKYQVRQL